MWKEAAVALSLGTIMALVWRTEENHEYEAGVLTTLPRRSVLKDMAYECNFSYVCLSVHKFVI
jgi:hypothetical protein